MADSDIALGSNPSSRQFFDAVLRVIAKAKRIVDETGQVDSAFPATLDCKNVNVTQSMLTKVSSKLKPVGYDIRKVDSGVEIFLCTEESGIEQQPSQSTCQFIPNGGSKRGIVCKIPIQSGTRCKKHTPFELEKAKAYARLYYASGYDSPDRLQEMKADLAKYNATCNSSFHNAPEPKGEKCSYIHYIWPRKGDRCNKSRSDGNFCRIHAPDVIEQRRKSQRDRYRNRKEVTENH